MDKLEARLENTEKALIALVTLLSDTLPLRDDITIVLEKYFDANLALGSGMTSTLEFK